MDSISISRRKCFFCNEAPNDMNLYVLVANFEVCDLYYYRDPKFVAKFVLVYNRHVKSIFSEEDEYINKFSGCLVNVGRALKKIFVDYNIIYKYNINFHFYVELYPRDIQTRGYSGILQHDYDSFKVPIPACLEICSIVCKNLGLSTSILRYNLNIISEIENETKL